MTGRKTCRSLMLVACLLLIFGTHISSQKVELIVETGLTNPFPVIVYSPDGKLIACVDGGKTIKIFDAASGHVLRSLVAHEKGTVSAEFSRDGNLLAVGSNDKTASVWEVRSGKEVGGSGELHSGVNAVHFSRDANSLFTFNEGDGIAEWNYRTGDELRSFAKDTVPFSAAFSPDGRSAALAGSRNVELWDLVRGIRTWLLTTSEMVTALAFSPDGKAIAAAGYDSSLTILSATGGETKRTLSGLTNYANSVAFSADGKLLGTGSKGGNVRIWNILAGRVVSEPASDGTEIHSVTFSPIGGTFAFATAGRSIRIVDAASGKRVRELVTHIDPVNWLAVSRDFRTIATTSIGGRIKLWNTGSGGELILLNTSGGLPPVAFSVDGKTLVSGGDDGSVTIWDVATGVQKTHLVASHREYLRSVALSADATRIAAGSHDGTVTVWDIPSSKEIMSVNGGRETSHVGFSLDGRLVGAQFSTSLSLWDIASGRDLVDHNGSYSEAYDRVLAQVPDLLGPDKSTLADEHQYWRGPFQIELGRDDEMLLYKQPGGQLIASLFQIDEHDWVVATPGGRFDTDRPLDRIDGLHWVVDDEITRPLPLEIFMRQYYEPNLLQRLMKCTADNTCDKEFKPLPPIGQINRVQPNLGKPNVSVPKEKL